MPKRKASTNVVCRIAATALSDLRQNPLDPNQKLEGSELRFASPDIEETAARILARPGIEVLHPWSLRERIRQRAQEMARTHAAESSQHCYSPNGHYRLEVNTDTQTTESGPITYIVEELSYRIYDRNHRLILQHQSTRASNDGETPTQSGVQSWGFRSDSQALELIFWDGTRQHFLLANRPESSGQGRRARPQPQVQTQTAPIDPWPNGDDDFWNAR